MHSHFSRTHQPYAKYGYSIFVAEIASTLNEQLQNEYLLSGAKPMMQTFIVNNLLEDIRLTFFRQIMFAEFGAWMYERVWNGEPLTPDDMEKKYFELNVKYYGPNVTINDEIHAEWSFIPHFYYDFYVYKYATSLALSNMFTEQVLHGGKQELENYLNLLRAGGSDDPAALILKAGQDVNKPDYLVALMKKFETLLDEFQGMKIN